MMTTIAITYGVSDLNNVTSFLWDDFPSAIRSLVEQTEPQWGRMSAQHMLEHLWGSFQIATDRMDVECQIDSDELQKRKAFLLSNKSLPKRSKSPVSGDRLPGLKLPDFGTARDHLLEGLQYFRRYYNDHPEATQINPAFGELNKKQWHVFHFKHCFHHCLQFELVEED